MSYSEIYPPSEDSYFLSEIIKEKISKNKSLKILDMGSGSGIQAETMLNLGIKPQNITLVDINKKAIKELRKKFPKLNAVHSDLFSNIKDKYDLIIFNPPYLPEHERDMEKDTTGGKKGSETINEFLKQAKEHLSKNGFILLLTSSLTKGIDWNNYKKELIGKKKLFFEELYVWKLSQ